MYICMKLTIICQKSLRSVGTKAGLFMTTSQLLDQHAPELAYSVAAGCADVWGPSGVYPYRWGLWVNPGVHGLLTYVGMDQYLLIPFLGG